jgi:hypothetical protein
MSRPAIAIIGASRHRHKFGNKAVRAYVLRGYDVYPIHPVAAQIEGRRAYPSVAALPVEALERVSVYVPPEVGLQVLGDVASKPVGELWLNPGAESAELIERARALGLNVVTGCSIAAIGLSPHDME